MYELSKLKMGRQSEVKESVYNIYDLNESVSKTEKGFIFPREFKTRLEDSSQETESRSNVVKIMVNSKFEGKRERLRSRPTDFDGRSNSEYLAQLKSKQSLSTSSKFSKIRSIAQLNESVKSKPKPNLLRISHSINPNTLGRSSFRKLNKKCFRNTILDRVKDFQKTIKGSFQKSILESKIKRQQKKQNYLDQLIQEKRATQIEKQIIEQKLENLTFLFNKLAEEL